MPSLSISLTLGKASEAHGTNVDHNNRNFIAKNVDSSKTPENITYVKQDVEESYDELFAKALEEYNSKQNRNDRIIQNYYNHISKSKREEAFMKLSFNSEIKILPLVKVKMEKNLKKCLMNI